VENHSRALFRSGGHGDRQSRHADKAVTAVINFDSARRYYGGSHDGQAGTAQS
jgi:hypothetical protein